MGIFNINKEKQQARQERREDRRNARNKIGTSFTVTNDSLANEIDSAIENYSPYSSVLDTSATSGFQIKTVSDFASPITTSPLSITPTSNYSSIFDTSATSSFTPISATPFANQNKNSIFANATSSISDEIKQNNYLLGQKKEKEIEKKKEKSFEAKQIFKGTIEIGELQSGFASEGHELSLDAISALTGTLLFDKSSLITKINVMYIMPESFILSCYKMMNYLCLSDVSNVETRVINAFCNGSGLEQTVIDNKYCKLLLFDENSSQSKMLRTNSIFERYYSDYLLFIKNNLSDYLKSKSIDHLSNNIINSYNEKPDFSNFRDILKFDYYALMGGVQKVIIDLEIEHTKINEFMVKSEMQLIDWYGADLDDITVSAPNEFNIFSGKDIIGLAKKIVKSNIPPLNAFFFLQHKYNYKPFATKLVYSSTDKITV